jgi:hypothetical protein
VGNPLYAKEGQLEVWMRVSEPHPIVAMVLSKQERSVIAAMVLLPSQRVV